MPDLKTELSKVLDEWNKPETTMTNQTTRTAPHSAFVSSNNVCRATFDNIRDNPGKTRQENAAMLESAGYKKSSTTSLIGQMVRQGMVRDTGGLLYVISTEYRPIKSYKAFAKQQGVALPLKRVVAPKRRELEEAPVEKEWTAESVIGNLNVRQALAVFDELRKIFGG